VEDDDEDALKLIQEHVDNNPIMLYKKGNPSMPMCKFCTMPTLGVSKKPPGYINTTPHESKGYIMRAFIQNTQTSAFTMQKYSMMEWNGVEHLVCKFCKPKVLTLVVSMSWTIEEFVKAFGEFKRRKQGVASIHFFASCRDVFFLRFAFPLPLCRYLLFFSF
jgi:hypothetical protein